MNAAAKVGEFVEHIRSLVIRFIVYGAALAIVISLYARFPLGTALFTAAIVTILAYLIGDIILLPNVGNKAASIVNALIAGAAAWLVLLGRLPPALSGVTAFATTGAYRPR